MPGTTQIPLVRLYIPFLAGIIAVTSFGITISKELLFILLIPLFIFIIFSGYYFKFNYHNRWIFGFIIFLFLFSAGNNITVNQNEKYKTGHFSNYLNQDGYAILDITEPVSERQNSYRVVGRVRKIISDTIGFDVIGKAMLYLEKDSLASTLKYGDRIITNNDFSPVQPPQNPYQFNYKRYLSFSNIHYQGYRSSGKYDIIASDKGNMLKSKALQIRKKAMQTLQTYSIQDREFAVLSALLLGYREYIDDDLRQEFAGAGAMHILCVSGLHVGIIYLILNSIFSFFSKIKNGKIIKTIIIILLIWFYATLTGFSPSVLRASTMFSFIALARSFNRYTNIYNILAASAFVLTIINPYIVTRIGFQLSYLAVISIVTLQPHFYNLIFFKNKLPDKIWAITTVSVAAQIGTGPLALYYFNQFPNYFILTNIVVIPLASIIIYTALAFLIISPITALAELTGKMLSFFVYLMHKSVKIIESLPYSTLQNVNMDLGTTLTTFALITLFTGFYIYKSRTCFKIALPAIAILAIITSVKSISINKQNSFIVYSINNHSAIDFISGKSCTFLASDDLISTANGNLDFNVTQNRIRRGINKVDNNILEKDTSAFSKHYLWKRNNYILFNDLKIKILTDLKPYNPDLHNNTKKLNLDYLIVSQNPWFNISDVKEKYCFEKIIFDASNPFWKVNQWIKECEDLGLNYWSVRHEGAYVRDL